MRPPAPARAKTLVNDARAQSRTTSRSSPRPLPEGEGRTRWRRVVGAGAVLLVVAALYAPTLGGEFIVDDRHYIVENPAVTRGAPLGDDFLDAKTTSSSPDYRVQVYRPLRTLAFRAVAATFGVRRPAYAATNLALYLSSIVLLLALVARLAPAGTEVTAVAIGGVALWALLPVHVEPVVYASALGDQLSLALQLASLLSGMAAVTATRRVRAVVLGAASVALLAAALLAKEMAVTGVVLFALVVAARHGARALGRRRVVVLVLAQAAVTAGFVALRTHVVGQLGQEPITAGRLAAGFGVAPVLVWEYARITLAPIGHTVAYALARPSALSEALAAIGIVALGAVLAVAVGRARSAEAKAAVRGVALGCAWFGAALLPVLQIVPVKADLADRFALVPSVGAAIALASVLSFLASRRPGLGRLAPAPLALVAMLCAVGVVLEARPYASDALLWRHAVAAEPRSALAHYNLGVLYVREQRDADGLRELDTAVRLGRDSAETQLRRSVALQGLGQDADADRAVDAALALDPKHAAAYVQRGLLREARGDLAGAAEALDQAGALEPDNAWFAVEAGRVAERRDRPKEAAADYARALALDDRPALRYRHARALLNAGEASYAATEARLAAHQTDAPEAWGLFGRALVSINGDPEEARPALARALSALPDGDDRRAAAAALATLDAAKATKPASE